MGQKLVWVAALSVSLLACSKKGPECESIVRVINPSAEKLSKTTESNPDKPEDAAKQLQAMAKIAGDTATDLGKVNLTVPELQKFSADYQAMAKEMSDASNTLADLLNNLDKADPVAAANKLKAASDKMEAAEKKEGPLVDGLNKFCGAP